MEKFKVSFVANNQQLTATGTKHASDTYADIEATFALGERWTDMDSVSAVWWNDFTRIATVLDSEGKCTVPHEVLMRKGCVRVNLVGSVVENGELVTRLTSYSAEAVHVNEKIKLTGSETTEITPSQFEQFVENVKADADRAESAKESAQDASASAQGYAQSASASASSASESATSAEQSATASARDAQTVSEIAVEVEVMKNEAELARDEILGMSAEAVTLPAGSEATASYADGLLSLGIPRGNTGATGAKGDKGDTGATPNLTIGDVETLEPTESATATITGTAENPVLNLGIPQGDTGEVSLADLSTLLPTDTASGEIASFPDGQSVIPVVSLIADIEPIQSGSGTPSPDNVRPISGRTEVVTQRTGKNLFSADKGDENLSSTYGMQKVLSNDVDAFLSFTPKVSNPSLPNNTSFGFVLDPTRVNDGFQWTFLNGQVQTGGKYGKNQTVNGSAPVGTLCKYVFWYPKGALPTILTQYDIQLELGSTATDFEPYLGDTYTTDLGRTVYGGKLDVVSGELTVDRAMVDLGTLNWTRITTGESPYFRTPTDAIPYKYMAEQSNYICENYQYTSIGSTGSAVGIMITNTISIRIRDNTYSDSQSFKSAMNGVQLCYELATPQTYQLDPQTIDLLLGDNNVWTDSGAVEVVYRADVGLYIDKKLN